MKITTITRETLLSNIYPTIHAPHKVPKNIVSVPIKGMLGIVMTFSYQRPNNMIQRISTTDMEHYQLTISDLITAINTNPYESSFFTVSSYFHIEDDFPMYTLTNKDMEYGAGAICISSVLNQVIDTFKDDFYIFPSSVHELILLPVSACAGDENELPQMVYDINQGQVEEKDRLSNHVYRFHYKTGTISTIQYTE